MNKIKQIKSELSNNDYSFSEDTVEDFYVIQSGIEKGWYKLDGANDLLENSRDVDNQVIQNLIKSIKQAQMEIKKCSDLMETIMEKSETYD